MIIHWEDRDWEWDPEAVTPPMAREIRNFTGRGLRSWGLGISDGEPDSLIALWWAIQSQNGVTRNITDLDDLRLSQFLLAVDEAARKEMRRQMAAQAPEVKFRPKAGSSTRKATRTSGRTATGTSSS